MQASADVAGFVLRAATIAYCEHVFALKRFNVNILKEYFKNCFNCWLHYIFLLLVHFSGILHIYY